MNLMVSLGDGNLGAGPEDFKQRVIYPDESL